MRIKRVTTVLVVDSIEPLLPRWCDQLGFVMLAKVPRGEQLGFVLLERDGQQVMMQTRASLAEDLPAVAQREPQTLTYVDTDDLGACVAAMSTATVLVPERTTFYGAREVFFADESGRIIAFAEHAG